MKNWVARAYQKYCVDLGKKKSLALFLDPGLGKTTILLSIFCWLKKYKKAKGALVIAPINPLYLTWPDEIKSWREFSHLRYAILHNKPSRHLIYNKRKIDIYLANPESIGWICEWLKKTPKEQWPFDVLIVDESTKFKDTSSSRTKALVRQVRHFKRRYIANGTPTGNGFLGLFSQMFIVDLGKTLGVTKGEYTNKYFKLVGNPKWFQYGLRNKNSHKEILKAIKPSTICLQAEDHIHIPREVIQPKYINLPKNALKIYEEIEKELYSEINEEEFVAESGAAKANMLHQICNGNLYFTPDPLEEYVPPIKRGYTQLHKQKLYALEDLIEEVQGKQVLIGYKYKHDKEALKKHFGKKIQFFDSSSNKKIMQDKWNKGRINIMAGQVQSLGFGLNLQKGQANIIVLYSLISDFEVFDQFIRRLRRSGNTQEAVYVYILLAKGLYDHEVTYKTLQNREVSHKETFEYLKKHLEKRKEI